MKWLAAASILVALWGCTRSDDVRESVAVQKASTPASSAPMSVGTVSEVPNSVNPDDAQLGGGIQH
jgi:hypothetical protein